MERVFVISLVACLCLVGSVSAYSGSRVLTDTFDGPDMTTWDQYAPGAYNGTGQYVLSDAEGILRYIDAGPYTAIIDVTGIALATGDPGSGNAGYLSLLLYDTGYRLQISIVNANDGGGDVIAFLGDKGNGYELFGNYPVGNLTSLTLKYEWNPEANTISAWAAVNGGPMTLYVDNQISHTNGTGPMLEQINAAEYYSSGDNTPDSPSFALDHYEIVGPQVTILEGDGVNIDEEAPSFDTYDIVLSTEPNEPNEISMPVIVTVTPDDQVQVNGAGAGNPIQLSFSKTDWFTPQTVTVTAIDDTDQEGTPHYATITHTASSEADANYDGLPVVSVQVVIADNEHWCGEPGTVYRAADISGPDDEPDCYVNLFDLAAVAASWLTCTDPYDPVNCDLVL